MRETDIRREREEGDRQAQTDRQQWRPASTQMRPWHTLSGEGHAHTEPCMSSPQTQTHSTHTQAMQTQTQHLPACSKPQAHLPAPSPPGPQWHTEGSSVWTLAMGRSDQHGLRVHSLHHLLALALCHASGKDVRAGHMASAWYGLMNRLHHVLAR